MLGPSIGKPGVGRDRPQQDDIRLSGSPSHQGLSRTRWYQAFRPSVRPSTVYKKVVSSFQALRQARDRPQQVVSSFQALRQARDRPLQVVSSFQVPRQARDCPEQGGIRLSGPPTGQGPSTTSGIRLSGHMQARDRPQQVVSSFQAICRPGT
ncbi:hypothetical protein PoB_002293000 [Plakobranchus ocellatus]|uniref:Uncharacterized protein n=1 Tax=Plakobranchus ocellatus TaxID=259542 RepID=A0AAV3ZL77_9GAST|nr:hypothetical protein PoB_002293000 [Plakobranchus ocellatus]